LQQQAQAQVQVQALERVLAQEQPLALALALALALEQVLEPRHHRNLLRLLLVSSWHHASTDRYRSSMCRQRHCASCQQFERLRRLKVLRWQSTSPMY